MPTKCDRCKQPMQMSSMSRFNEDMLCTDCLEAEKKHPDYQHACSVELAAVLRGDYNFPGVGWPGKDGRVER